jgi:PilZ domain
MNERRSDPRSAAPGVRSITGRIRGGHAIAFVDISPSGALIAGARPLRPGARVEMHVGVETRQLVMFARVVRCLVAAIDADHGMTYHAALSFERRIEWPCEVDTRAGSRLHEAVICATGKGEQ